MSESESLKGRVYAITGGSKGMGLRFARALTAEGAEVVILARGAEALDAVRAELPRALVLSCDVSASEDVNRAFAAIGERHGKLNGLVNNAAACLVHKIEEASDAEIAAQVNANLVGPLYCIRAAIPLLRASGAGDIVNVSSESVRLPFPYLTLYAATKAGLESLSAGLRAELRPDKIRVTVLRSGSVAGSSLGTSWAPERIELFYEAAQASGAAAFTGVAITPETVAESLLHILKLPREANLDMVELRAI